VDGANAPFEFAQVLGLSFLNAPFCEEHSAHPHLTFPTAGSFSVTLNPGQDDPDPTHNRRYLTAIATTLHFYSSTNTYNLNELQKLADYSMACFVYDKLETLAPLVFREHTFDSLVNVASYASSIAQSLGISDVNLHTICETAVQGGIRYDEPGQSSKVKLIKGTTGTTKPTKKRIEQKGSRFYKQEPIHVSKHPRLV
jgi:hypothetical protein